MMKNDRNRHKKAARAAILLLAGLTLAVLSSCGRSAGSPEIKLKAPAAPAAGDVTISVDVTNFSLAGSQGRIIYYLDTPVPTYYDHSGVSKAGTFAVSSETTHTWSGVTPGEHKFAVQLVDMNNSPLPLPVMDTMTVTVGAPDGAPSVSIADLKDGDTLPPGNILISVDAGGFIVSPDDMGVVNRLGEGHLIYYIDETPPTDAGVPATTETSIVSTAKNHLWKSIPEGMHTFSVQLVNNDDTPLEKPVVATVSITVSAA